MATRFDVTGILDGTAVPGLSLRPVEIRAGLLGGKNGSGQIVPGGWSDFICAECGDSAAWCPDLRKVIEAVPGGRAWVADARAN